MPPHAIYFDGQSSRKQRVVLRFAGALEIIADEKLIGVWPYGDVRRADGPPDRLRLMSISALPLARLEIDDADTKQAVESNCTALDIHEGDYRQTWRIVGWSIAALSSILALVIYGIPYAADRLAFVVPAGVEKRLGDAVDRQVHFIFGDKVCTKSAGQAALATLVDRLKQAGGLQMPLDVQALPTPLPNALALPGGKIYVTDGLLQKARNPDEVAGALAHELGHVHNRDGMRHVIKTGGTAFLLGLLFGDVMGGGAVIFAARSLLDVSYSREAERAADAFAIDLMRKLGRSPKPMGELLLRITGPEAKALTILSTHPLSEERLAIMAKADRPPTGPDILSSEQWIALKGICGRP